MQRIRQAQQKRPAIEQHTPTRISG